MPAHPMHSSISPVAASAISEQPAIDMHTHLFAPSFGHSGPRAGKPMLLWGIDELLCYHYFVDELFRVVGPERLSPSQFFALPKRDRADIVWRELFVGRAPVSESCVGLIEVLTSLGLDPSERSLSGLRSWFAARDVDDHVDSIMEIAGLERVVMTNEVFDDHERSLWLSGVRPDSRFAAVVRIDQLLTDWPRACARLAGWGYDVREDGSGGTEREIARFLEEWIRLTGAIYLASSLPPEFRYPDDDGFGVAAMLDRCVVPAARASGVPIALMIGVRRGVHPAMRDAGDGVGACDVASVCDLAGAHPCTKWFVTLLSREDQHELCVAARKFGNILPFGCWWYVNTRSLIAEITRMRLELLGTSFVPQHSDARVLEQLVYKWRASREVIAECLDERYRAARRAGHPVCEEHARRDAGALLRDNFVAAISAAPRPPVALG